MVHTNELTQVYRAPSFLVVMGVLTLKYLESPGLGLGLGLEGPGLGLVLDLWILASTKTMQTCVGLYNPCLKVGTNNSPSLKEVKRYRPISSNDDFTS